MCTPYAGDAETMKGGAKRQRPCRFIYFEERIDEGVKIVEEEVFKAMKRIGFKIDEIFDLLKDLEWHTVDEISRKVSLPKPKVREALKLMASLGHIEYGRGGVRIDHKTLEWLRATVPPAHRGLKCRKRPKGRK